MDCKLPIAGRERINDDLVCPLNYYSLN